MPRIAFNFSVIPPRMLATMESHVRDWCEDRPELERLFEDLLDAFENERELRITHPGQAIGDFDLPVEDVGPSALRWGGWHAGMERDAWVSIGRLEAAKLWNAIFVACGVTRARLGPPRATEAAAQGDDDAEWTPEVRR